MAGISSRTQLSGNTIGDTDLFLSSKDNGNGTFTSLKVAGSQMKNGLSKYGKIGIPDQTTGSFTYYSTLESARDAAVSGDTIMVYPGTYTVTTTATNGIAKSGVNFYFHPGSTVNKTTAGDIFNDTGFASPCKVYGQGSFNKTTSAGLIYNSSLQYSEFNALDVSSTVSMCIQVSGSYTNINIRNGVSTASFVMVLSYISYSNIKFKYLRSTAWITLQMSGGSYNNVTGELVESTVNRAIYLAESNNHIFNISYVSGAGNSGFDSYVSSYTFNGNTNYLYPFGGGRITFNGFANTIRTSATITGGATCTTLQVVNEYGDAGSVNVLIVGSGAITVSAGVANVRLAKSCTYLYTNVTGGVLNFENTRLEDGYFYGAGYDFSISGGRVNLNNFQAELVDRWYGFKISGGILDLGSSRIKLNSSALMAYSNGASRNSGIKYIGGTIISNGARIITSNDNCLPIEATTAGLSIKVLSGGLNLNNISGLLSAKKQKFKITVSSVASSSITLNDGTGGNEVFTESSTATYNTTAALAARMVALINASSTLDITATQDAAGTDNYFYIESDVAGTPFTLVTYSNLTPQVFRNNSYALTNITGGSIIEDTDVE